MKNDRAITTSTPAQSQPPSTGKTVKKMDLDLSNGIFRWYSTAEGQSHSAKRLFGFLSVDGAITAVIILGVVAAVIYLL